MAIKLAEAMQFAGYSLRELSSLSGVSVTTLWKWGNGKVKPRPSTKRAVAKILGMKPGELE